MLQSLDALMRIAIDSDTIDEFEPEDSTQLYAKTNAPCDSIDPIADTIAEPEDEGDFGDNNEDEHEVTFGDDSNDDENESYFGNEEDEEETYFGMEVEE